MHPQSAPTPAWRPHGYWGLSGGVADGRPLATWKPYCFRGFPAGATQVWGADCVTTPTSTQASEGRHRDHSRGHWQIPACARMRARRPAFRPSSRGANSQGQGDREKHRRAMKGWLGWGRNHTLVVLALKGAGLATFRDLTYRKNASRST